MNPLPGIRPEPSRAASSSAGGSTPSAGRRWRRLMGDGRVAGVGHRRADGALPGLAHFAPKAKHVIYLHMVGGPSQLDLYDYKPKMSEMYDKDLPESIRNGQRLTTMTSGQKRFPIAPSKYKFAQHGKSGMWVSELLPHTAKMVDDMCFIRSMNTEAINHEPAITLMQTGNMVTGRPCLGSWVSYGLGSVNQNLPTFVVLVAKPSNTEQIQAISARLWSSGYLPGEHAGVSFRSGGDPILYINNPAGVPAEVRRKTLDGLRALNEVNYQVVGDPETHTRIEQYELAFRMQSSVPDLTDLANEPASTYDLYGDEAKKAGQLRPLRPAGPADGRARRPVRPDLPQQLGHPRQRRGPAAQPVQGRRPALLGPDPGPQGARPVRRDPGDLGRRVRPDDLLAGRALEGQLRPRPPPPLLHDVDGRRRHQARARSTARPTTSPTTSSRTRSTSATSTPRSSTSSASTTSGSPTATRGSTRS